MTASRHSPQQVGKLQVRPPPGLEGFAGGPSLHQNLHPPGVWKADNWGNDRLSAGLQTHPKPTGKQQQQPHPVRGQDQRIPSWLGAGETATGKPGGLAREMLRAKAAEYVATMLGPPAPPMPLSSQQTCPQPTPQRSDGVPHNFHPMQTGVPNRFNMQAPSPANEPATFARVSGTTGDGRVAANSHVPTRGREIPEEPPALPLSLGSVGHPHICAGACRYVKRKGGCREGAKCRSCHICFWRRDEEVNKTPQKEFETESTQGSADLDDGTVSTAADSTAGSDLITCSMSAGTQGHPFGCAEPCRYVRRKSGCRDGVGCSSCHACVWRRPLTDQVKDAAPADFVAEMEINMFDDSRNTLQNLIQLMIQNKDAEGMNGICVPYSL